MNASTHRRRVLGFAALLALVTAGLWLARSRTLPAGVQPDSRAVAAPPVKIEDVAALGRLRPKDGLIRIAGPSRPSVVIGQLLVQEGQAAQAGDVIAVLDTLETDEAGVARLEAELRNARSELAREENLLHAGSATGSQLDAGRLKVDVTASQLKAAQAALASDRVRAPVAGRILAVHARSGERVGPDGIVEIGQTDEMYALAEVYETDVARVHVGQHATIRSAALPADLHGSVERIGLKVGRLDILSTDPAADADARVVEVLIRLDEWNEAALTNLQVEVMIHADTAATARP